MILHGKLHVCETIAALWEVKVIAIAESVHARKIIAIVEGTNTNKTTKGYNFAVVEFVGEGLTQRFVEAGYTNERKTAFVKFADRIMVNGD